MKARKVDMPTIIRGTRWSCMPTRPLSRTPEADKHIGNMCATSHY
eukprot:CAMPEP_0204232120 /NCGR_PEP_ID=MMETSP0361-20130328/89192_1 /ASSEMBLY_ACC=CAM_ASM_000343 /TAXON_ID=268821 /ORGANISM="Scrippsiella Hangoei, Strain SHTV-5" /LENGTH=44 /DNA_ID= /DNA_START= /DNA_END= /DNA_ORIENTATION=